MELTFSGRRLELRPGETVLEGLERHGVEVPSLCRSGSCQSCMLRATAGVPPAGSQNGLKDAWKRQGYFLSCICKPTEPLTVARDEAARRVRAEVESVESLSEDVVRVRLTCAEDFEFEAGQFVQLIRPDDGLMRPYSIASLPSDGRLEFHVGLLPGGVMSGWLRTAAGRPIDVKGPFGECFYLPDEPDRPLLLAGTGTGLAPLVGVLRAALAAGHRGSIEVIHGSRNRAGLYYWDELRGLCAGSADVTVRGSVLETDDPSSVEGVESRPMEELVFSAERRFADLRVYLCGNPDLVHRLKKKIFLAGADLRRIHSDPFVAPAS